MSGNPHVVIIFIPAEVDVSFDFVEDVFGEKLAIDVAMFCKPGFRPGKKKFVISIVVGRLLVFGDRISKPLNTDRLVESTRFEGPLSFCSLYG